MRSWSRLPVLVFGALLAASTLSGCAALRSPAAPMPSVQYPAPRGDADVLIVLLPGRRDVPEDFARRGFVEALHRARPHADLVAVDAHLGYYRTRTFEERLWQDVLAPAAERYQEIWLLGISLGGIGSLGISARYPEAISGAVLLAPFLGDDALIEAIEAAGGPRSWQPSDADDPLQQFWLWARGHDPRQPPRLFLGFGSGDRLRDGCRQLARLLPEEQVAEVPGGHDWRAWSTLLEELLERDTLGAR